MIPLILALVGAVATPAPIEAPAPIAPPSGAAATSSAAAEAVIDRAFGARPTAQPGAAADAVVSQAFAPKASAAPLPPAPGSNGSALVLAVPMALGGLALLAWAARRNRKPSAAGHLEILQTLPLPTRRGLVVASLGAKTLLLGVTEGGVSVLSTSDAVAPTATAGLDGFPTSLQQAFDAAELERKLLAVAQAERM